MTKCLVIDDVQVTRYTATEYLKEMGVEVVVAENGDQALDEIQGSAFDVVLLDWHLGEDSGIDLLKKIRTNYGSGLPVVIFSGVEAAEKASEAMAAGASEFLEKPTTKEKLYESLSRLGLSIRMPDQTA